VGHYTHDFFYSHRSRSSSFGRNALDNLIHY
jgi:hypothetical protein